jgi:hypothetical protein
MDDYIMSAMWKSMIADRRKITETDNSYYVEGSLGKPGLCIHIDFTRADLVAFASPFPSDKFYLMCSGVIEGLTTMAMFAETRVIEL